jgi:hypothetical protein
MSKFFLNHHKICKSSYWVFTILNENHLCMTHMVTEERHAKGCWILCSCSSIVAFPIALFNMFVSRLTSSSPLSLPFYSSGVSSVYFCQIWGHSQLFPFYKVSFFCSAGIWTQGLGHTKQVIHQWAILLAFGFLRQDLTILLSLSLNLL